MPENHSRAGKEVERVSISDEPHERYRGFNPWTGEELDNGIPILTSTPNGNIVKKDVTFSTVKCPECEIPAKYTHDSEPVCPNCGVICAGKDTILAEQVVVDAKAAGRIEGETTDTPV
jgi:hypothetical protein